jgi:hypothetical protein
MLHRKAEYLFVQFRQGVKNGTVEKPDNAGVEKSEPKIGFSRFLRVSGMFQGGSNKDRGLAALLYTKYKSDVKTKSEWEATVKDLLQKKAQ